MNVLPRIEAVLFVASKPLTVHALAKSLAVSEGNVIDALETLKMKFNHPDSGIHVLHDEDMVQMATNSSYAEDVAGFTKEEITAELTRAQLETLTVIAYRSQVTRPELEEIRGVNCAVILRNLLIRGLIEEQKDSEKLMPVYSLSFDALAHLGIEDVTVLPEYGTLHTHEYIQHTLQEGGDEENSST